MKRRCLAAPGPRAQKDLEAGREEEERARGQRGVWQGSSVTTSRQEHMAGGNATLGK